MIVRQPFHMQTYGRMSVIVFSQTMGQHVDAMIAQIIYPKYCIMETIRCAREIGMSIVNFNGGTDLMMAIHQQMRTQRLGARRIGSCFTLDIMMTNTVNLL